MFSSKSRLAPWLWVGPALVIVAAYLVYPVIVTIYDSLMNGSLTKFIGLNNYVWAFTTEGPLLAFRNNIFWIITATIATVVLGLIFAVLSDRVRYESAAKAAIFMPMAISFVGAGVIWKFMYDWRLKGTPQIGLLNAVLTALQPFAAASQGVLLWILAIAAAIALVTFFIALIHTRAFIPSFIAIVILPLAVLVVAWLGSVVSSALGVPSGSLALLVLVIQIILTLVAFVIFAWTMIQDRFGGISVAGVVVAAICLGLLHLTNYQPVTWLQDEATNNWALVVVYVWIWTGFCMVTLSAALKGIPAEVLEAARVDGANEFQIFASVLVPMIGSTILVVATTMVINILKVFDVVYVMTSGAYHSDVIANALYYQAFHFQDFGRGAALAVILLAAVVPVMVFNVRRFREEEALR
jgi:alpha-glucoside transport system permease protein